MALKKMLRKRTPREPDTRSREDAPAPLPPVYETVADTLRHSRESYQLDLVEVARSLNIRRVYLEAIEAGEFDQLPGTTYAVGFVRAYSEFLRLDGNEMVQRFKEEAQGLDKKPELVFPTPVPESRLPSGALILISLLCLGLVYAGWSYLSSDEQAVSDLIPEVPERLRVLIGGDAVEPDPASDSGAPAEAAKDSTPDLSLTLPEIAPTPSPDSLWTVEPQPEDPVESPEPELAAIPDGEIPAAPAAPEIPLAPPSPALSGGGGTGDDQVYGSENADSRVTLKASQDSWVQIRDGSDGLLLARVLRAGESYRVPNQPGITMITGNAGGLEILVDGTSLGTIGAVGSVRRDIKLDPNQLLDQGTAVN